MSQNRKENLTYPYNLLADLGFTGALSDDQEKALDHVLSLLTDVQRTSLLMYYRDGLSYKEIAEKRNVHVSNGREAVSAALLKVRRYRNLIWEGLEAHRKSEEERERLRKMYEEEEAKEKRLAEDRKKEFLDSTVTKIIGKDAPGLSAVGVETSRDLLEFLEALKPSQVKFLSKDDIRKFLLKGDEAGVRVKNYLYWSIYRKPKEEVLDDLSDFGKVNISGKEQILRALSDDNILAELLCTPSISLPVFLRNKCGLKITDWEIFTDKRRTLHWLSEKAML